MAQFVRRYYHSTPAVVIFNVAVETLP